VRSAFLGAVVSAALLGVSCGGDESRNGSGVACEKYRFDKAAWDADSERTGDDGLTDRQRIADDLIRCRSVLGRTKRAVSAMLGPAARPESNRRMWLWIVGTERGPIKMRPETFQVRFTADGRVRNVRLSD
jgi:hypothetical protein